ncbi:hypothetical protein GCM10011374_36270 [Kocuria dechangensis]|uniref:Uncharacterized protein n=1 Tax=Kocuria dechangensis TaxID=1176249 RepID=A0A917H6H1_9MICC|nr:hypothetical protein [Kocuria dechangensis]GGG68626.1 hypothetical protein GCM10011374_36270 [Kocuria dechangensis]
MSTVAAIQAATVTIRLDAHGDEIVVAAYRNAHDAQTPLASTTLELGEGADVWLTPALFSYPHGTVLREDYLRAVGRDELQDAVESVGRTGIAHLIGLEQFLSTARHLLVEVRPKGTGAEVVVTTRTLMMETTGLLDVAPYSELSVEITATPTEGQTTQALTPGREGLIWPVRSRVEELPSAVDPILAYALTLIGDPA